MVYLATAFDFDPAAFTASDAERHYHDHHVPLASRLPGLRRYVIGPLVSTRTIPADRARGAILAFDSIDALRAAYRSPAGTELRADENRLIRNARLMLIDGTEIV
jgi:uncharacterized protein (TIGR02118 family)